MGQARSEPYKRNDFELINNGSDDWADREGIGYLLNEQGYADAICTKSFVDMLQTDPADVRNEVVLPAMYDKNLKKTYGENPIFINKFPLGALGDMRLANLPILRLSEVYLNAAEAAAKLGGAAKAEGIKYLNDLLDKRTKTPTAKVSDAIADDEFLSKVLIERRKELVGEGQRFSMPCAITKRLYAIAVRKTKAGTTHYLKNHKVSTVRIQKHCCLFL